MSRPKIKFMLTLAVLSGVAGDSWDDSNDRVDYYNVNQLLWPRFDNPELMMHLNTDVDNRLTPTRKVALVQESVRERRDVSDDAKPERNSGVREARMSAPDTWSKQTLSFRHRTNQPDNFSEDSGDNDEPTNLPPLIRAHYAPKTDFVTSPRGRGMHEGRQDVRESRDMPIARSYDEYDVPIFRNIVREHDFDVQIPRNYYYPNRYRSQRDYYYRGGGSAINPYLYDRYRDEEEDYELYGRYRSTPKPKRIIYYATLPEIVRKPVDIRNYQRPYDPLVRAPEAQIEPDRNRVASNNVEPNRRPLRYPYDNYDNYVKRSSYYDRRRPPYAADDDDRPRDQERSRGNYKEKLRSDDRQLENQLARSGDRRLPWPVQIGTEVSVKDNDRIPGRKIFGQIEGYERYEGSRIKKTSGNAERKEDVNDSNDNNNENVNNNNSNDN